MTSSARCFCSARAFRFEIVDEVFHQRVHFNPWAIYRLPENVQEHLRKSIATLSKNNGLTLVMALSYGSRIEIVEAVRSIAER